jgi:ABC-type polar amino acid transport system ATPase subunit
VTARPKCLLLDAPSLGLAPIAVTEISRTIRTLAQHGLTILLVEQNAAMALELADRRTYSSLAGSRWRAAHQSWRGPTWSASSISVREPSTGHGPFG